MSVFEQPAIYNFFQIFSEGSQIGSQMKGNDLQIPKMVFILTSGCMDQMENGKLQNRAKIIRFHPELLKYTPVSQNGYHFWNLQIISFHLRPYPTTFRQNLKIDIYREGR